jgi:hypothetical protein
VVSLIGKGAKCIKVDIFDLAAEIQGIAVRSEQFIGYRQIADAMQLVARGSAAEPRAVQLAGASPARLREQRLGDR